MSDSHGDGFSIPWPAIVTLLAVVGGVFLYLPTLESSRPVGDQGVPSGELVGFADVPARLWQDPLAAAASARDADVRSRSSRPDRPLIRGSIGALQFEVPAAPTTRPAAFHTLDALARELKAELALDPPGQEVLLMPVMMQGGSYPENAEQRLRMRHAVLSALGISGYLPRDDERMGYIEVDWRRQPPTVAANPDIDNQIDGKLLVPYELCGRRPVQSAYFDSKLTRNLRSVVILWLKEDAFRDRPLARFGKLLGDLKEKLTGARDADKLVIKAIAPRSTTVLSAMIHEALSLDTKPKEWPYTALNRISLFSPTATGDPETVYYPFAPGPNGVPMSLTREMQALGITFVPTIGTDRRLAEELVAELQRRGVYANKDAIALVGEWDTIYARAAAFAFASAAHGTAMNVLTGDDGSLIFPKNIYRRNYLRGIDGRLPRPASSDNDQAARRRGRSTSDTTGGNSGGNWDAGGLSAWTGDNVPNENPEGHAQADYLRRLSEELVVLDRTLRRETAQRHGIRAIGVLGSDVYDKLLVLKALRDSFPDALFFTTDYDARYVHPAEFNHARNLIIASHFGPTTRLDRGARLAPFRDGYQTSTFCGVLAALGHWRMPLDPMAPRLFEVGRKGAVDLSVDDGGDVHPVREDLRLWWNARRAGLIGIAIVCAVVALVWLIQGPKGSQWERLHHWIPFSAFAVLLAAGMLVVVDMMLKADDEPMYLFRGVSLWPTEAVRFIAILFAIRFLYVGWRTIAKSDKVLTESYELGPPGVPCPSVRAWWKDVSLILFRPPAPKFENDEHGRPKEKPLNAEKLWQEYLYRGKMANRVTRFLPVAAVFFGAGLPLMSAFGFPHSPYRETFSYVVDILLKYGSMALYVVITFAVADAIRLCERFTEQLCKETYWPKSTLHRLATDRHLPWHMLDEYLDIQLIARQSEAILPLIYYPFIVLTLIIVSRNSYFDKWTWPTAMLAMMAIAVALSIGWAWVLRNVAEQAREGNLRSLRKKRLRIPDGQKDLVDRLDVMIKEIEDERRGAFASFSHNPALRAFLLPSGGLGILSLLELLARQ